MTIANASSMAEALFAGSASGFCAVIAVGVSFRFCAGYDGIAGFSVSDFSISANMASALEKVFALERGSITVAISLDGGASDAGFGVSGAGELR
ncbi:MAG TPA: hypothetical protein VKB78_07960, partial [Pirellulales bacterium]|nr:hypothetical protein [Pirellulales bacterium]